MRRVTGEQFQVFAINCAHLGCPVRWFPAVGLFMCPCHGGAYYEDGSRASGPPPRGLYEYEYQIREGQLWVRGGPAAHAVGTGVRRPSIKLFRSANKWVEDRAGLEAAVAPMLAHRVPRSTASWWYVFGSATLALFVLQIATGICLALVYVPSADEA